MAAAAAARIVAGIGRLIAGVLTAGRFVVVEIDMRIVVGWLAVLALDKLKPVELVLGMRLVLWLDRLAELALLALGTIVVVELDMLAERVQLELGRTVVVVGLGRLAELELDMLAELELGRTVVELGILVGLVLDKMAGLEAWVELVLGRIVELGMLAVMGLGRIVVELGRLVVLELGRIVELGMLVELVLDRPVELLQLELGTLAELGMLAEMIDTADIVGIAEDSRSSKV